MRIESKIDVNSNGEFDDTNIPFPHLLLRLFVSLRLYQIVQGRDLKAFTFFELRTISISLPLFSREIIYYRCFL